MISDSDRRPTPQAEAAYMTLGEAVVQAERDDPAVAEAARRLDAALDEIRERQALHAFRPLPWDTRPMFALDADVTVYWPDVRPCYEEE